MTLKVERVNQICSARKEARKKNVTKSSNYYNLLSLSAVEDSFLRVLKSQP